MSSLPFVVLLIDKPRLLQQVLFHVGAGTEVMNRNGLNLYVLQIFTYESEMALKEAVLYVRCWSDDEIPHVHLLFYSFDLQNSQI